MISLHDSDFFQFKFSEGHKQISKSQLFVGIKLVFLCYILLHALNKYNCIHLYGVLNLQNLYTYQIYSLQSIWVSERLKDLDTALHSGDHLIIVSLCCFLIFYYAYHLKESNDYFEVISLPLYYALEWEKGLLVIGSWMGLPGKIQGTVKF